MPHVMLIERLVGPLLTRWPAAEALILFTAVPLIVLEAVAWRVARPKRDVDPLVARRAAPRFPGRRA